MLKKLSLHSFCYTADKYLNIYMNSTDNLVQNIVAGIQEKKGKKIVIIDLSEFENTICSYFIVCEGASNTHVDGVANSIVYSVKEKTGERPANKDGFENSQWIAIDYVDVMVHVFQREQREFYNLEALWADGKITEIEDLD